MACWCKGECPLVPPARDLLEKGNRRRAEKTLKLALTNAPNCVEGNLMLAGILNVTNRPEAAAVHVERAIAIEGPGWKAEMCRADNMRADAHPDQAVAYYMASIALDPTKPESHFGLIVAAHHAGFMDAAEEAAVAAMKLFPENREIIRAAAAVEAEQKHFETAAAMLEGDNRPISLLDRGRYLDRLGDYDGAWNCFMRGKRSAGPRQQFNRRDFDRIAGGLLDLATKKKQAAMPTPTYPKLKGPAPLFITGFPRSGTTMFETAMAAHSKIAPADELPFIPQLSRTLAQLVNVDLAYPQAMMALGFGENKTVLSTLRGMYLDRAAARLGAWKKGTAFFTDKMPLNEIHLPLMLRLFPESPIYYVRRHPLDIIVSNMSYGISHGFNYASSPRTAAYAYAAIDALLVQYGEIWPDAVHEVRYENFVANPVEEIDAAMATAGLTPEAGCYDFHKSGRHSRTISNRQIKEPLYDRSVGRYKNYLAHLEPIIETVRPIIEREGYAI